MVLVGFEPFITLFDTYNSNYYQSHIFIPYINAASHGILYYNVFWLKYLVHYTTPNYKAYTKALVAAYNPIP
jgi:hypothetical protein